MRNIKIGTPNVVSISYNGEVLQFGSNVTQEQFDKINDIINPPIKGFTWEWAKEQVKLGKFVKCVEWDVSHYLYMKNGVFIEFCDGIDTVIYPSPLFSQYMWNLAVDSKPLPLGTWVNCNDVIRIVIDNHDGYKLKIIGGHNDDVIHTEYCKLKVVEKSVTYVGSLDWALSLMRHGYEFIHKCYDDGNSVWKYVNGEIYVNNMRVHNCKSILGKTYCFHNGWKIHSTPIKKTNDQSNKKENSTTKINVINLGNGFGMCYGWVNE